ncbi:GHKL domain-containing protein [Lachnospiraceae bacterium OF11-28]|nr:GHKL domain-containing protein [Clostridium sp. MCC328]RGE05499.1 GHKL domain-containing protein [Clostridium sp. AM34-11AC]RGE17283.1 GHKL domain-containing protein [Lachnospiraceae bacterium OF11-28]
MCGSNFLSIPIRKSGEVSMAELLINEFFSTYPFHMFAYLPFHTNLRYPGKITILLSALAEIIYLAVFAILVHAGFPAVSVQYLAIPILGFFLYHLVQANIGIVTFQYTFVLDYLMVIRASSFFICRQFLHCGFYTWQSGVTTLLLVLLTTRFMIKRLTEIIDSLSAIQAPAIWKTAWLLPFSATMIIFLLTGNIRDGNFDQADLFARVLLLVCMFLISHTLIMLLRFFKDQAEAAAKSETMEKLLEIQSDQYSLLTARIQDNRRARHDFRQHLAVIRDCADRGDLASLKNYLNDYENMFPIQEVRTYCKNYAVNAILSFYAEKAEKNGISMQVTIQMADPPVIPETEFCVLVGNLLENAVDACADTDAEIQSFIRLHVVQTGSSMLSITADNTSSGSPNWSGDKLLSTKHSGYGIGTESIRMIAERYSGDARFRWKDGIFYASVMLNPQV